MDKFIDYFNITFPDINISILDVGARDGFAFTPLEPLTRLHNKSVTAIEPDIESAEKLKEQNYSRIYTEAVCAKCDKDKDMNLYLTMARGCSSVLEPNFQKMDKKNILMSSWFKVDKTIKIKTIPILEILKNQSFDIIKIDVQGYDYPILYDISQFYKDKIIGIFAEGQFFEHYKKQYFVWDILKHMYDEHFNLAAIDVYDKDGIVAEADISLINNFCHITSKSLFLKYLLFAVLSKKGNLVMYLLRNYGDNYLDDETIDNIYQILSLPKIPKEYRAII